MRRRTGETTARPRWRQGGGEAADGGDCSITINSVPWSEVWIDGKNTTKHTPFVDYKLPCGKHKLAFKRPDMQIDHSESITVRAGQTFKQRYTLDDRRAEARRAPLRTEPDRAIGSVGRDRPTRCARAVAHRRAGGGLARVSSARAARRPRHPAARDFLHAISQRGAGPPDPRRRAVLEVGLRRGRSAGGAAQRAPHGHRLPARDGRARARAPSRASRSRSTTPPPRGAGRRIGLEPRRGTWDAVVCDRLCHSVLDVKALLAGLQAAPRARRPHLPDRLQLPVGGAGAPGRAGGLEAAGADRELAVRLRLPQPVRHHRAWRWCGSKIGCCCRSRCRASRRRSTATWCARPAMQHAVALPDLRAARTRRALPAPRAGQRQRHRAGAQRGGQRRRRHRAHAGDGRRDRARSSSRAIRPTTPGPTIQQRCRALRRAAASCARSSRPARARATPCAWASRRRPATC